MSDRNPYSLRLRFWGVRGSTPTPVPGYLRFGGNTSCVEVETGSGNLIILDAGTGLRLMGDELMERASRDGSPLQINILLSHLHWDHIQGFPFFRPAFDKRNTVTIWGASAATRLIQSGFRNQLSEPYFPVAFGELPANVSFRDLPIGHSQFLDAKLTTEKLHHPQGATAYRLQCDSRVITYAADHEHGDNNADRALIELARDSDVMIADAQFTPEEYPRHRGWGHSTWPEVIRIARAAGVKQLVMTHHDPWHDDSVLDSIERLAKAEFPNASLAREGMEILL